jgi:hypothetical protein
MTVRRPLTKKQRAGLLAKSAGLCDGCGRPIAGTWHADHWVPVALGGTNAQTQVLCLPCHKVKTAFDVAAIAKAKRAARKLAVTKRVIRDAQIAHEDAAMRMADEPKPKRKMQSRGFDKTRTRHFDGTVTLRAK